MRRRRQVGEDPLEELVELQLAVAVDIDHLDDFVARLRSDERLGETKLEEEVSKFVPLDCTWRRGDQANTKMLAGGGGGTSSITRYEAFAQKGTVNDIAYLSHLHRAAERSGATDASARAPAG